jgi:hypothetical protein
MRSHLAQLAYRIRSDYLIGSRRPEYDELLRRASALNYDLLSLIEFYDLEKNIILPTGYRCIGLRHDVDVGNVASTRMLHKVEEKHNAHATYYFRLSTAAKCEKLIGLLLARGFEVGYHFEEAATLAKRRHLQSRAEVFSYREEIQTMFRQNCQAFRSRYNTQLRSVCSHGDWINRKLGFINNEFLDDHILEECGLSFEAYQQSFKCRFDDYISDVATFPDRWARGRSPEKALDDGKERIYLLTHDRQWHPGPIVNTVANVERVWEAFCYRSKL